MPDLELSISLELGGHGRYVRDSTDIISIRPHVVECEGIEPFSAEPAQTRQSLSNLRAVTYSPGWECARAPSAAQIVALASPEIR